jgi:hypothetical protein
MAKGPRIYYSTGNEDIIASSLSLLLLLLTEISLVDAFSHVNLTFKTISDTN